MDEDRAKLDTHVCPVIGDLRLEDVRPRHLQEVVTKLQSAGYAPRTVRNLYFLAKALFRDAQIAELVPLGQTPAILTRRQLGKRATPTRRGEPARSSRGPSWRRSSATRACRWTAA